MGQVKVIPVVIDTNVMISALLFGGTPGKLIDLWKAGRIQIFVCKEMIDEMMRVLTYPRFQLTEKEINYLLYYEILAYAEIVDILSGPEIVSQDPSDQTSIPGDEPGVSAERHGSNGLTSQGFHRFGIRHRRTVRFEHHVAPGHRPDGR